jgi:hypothetical protein
MPKGSVAGGRRRRSTRKSGAYMPSSQRVRTVLVIIAAALVAGCNNDCPQETRRCGDQCYLDYEYLFCGDADHCITCPPNAFQRCGGTPTAPQCSSRDGGS